MHYLSTVGRFVFQSESMKLCLHRNLFLESRRGGLLHMITISLQTIYYALGIASILCGAAYKIGYELGKNARK